VGQHRRSGARHSSRTTGQPGKASFFMRDLMSEWASQADLIRDNGMGIAALNPSHALLPDVNRPPIHRALQRKAPMGLQLSS
jgi:hypothetical protein